MSAWYGLEQFDDGLLLMLLLVFALLIALAVACAPAPPEPRLPALARRPRDTGRY